MKKKYISKINCNDDVHILVGHTQWQQHTAAAAAVFPSRPNCYTYYNNVLTCLCAGARNFEIFTILAEHD